MKKIFLSIFLSVVLFLPAFAGKDTDYFRSGIEKAKKFNYKGAITDYDKAISINPNNTDYYCLRGGVRVAIKDYDNALMDLNKAISINPNKAAYYEARAQYKLKLAYYDEAIENYSIAINLNPGNSNYYFWRGYSKGMAKDT